MKIFTLLLLSVIMHASTIAQPVIKHQKTIGSNLYDFFESMDLTKDGGLIAGGSSASNISYEKTENSRGKTDYWVVKLNSFGNIQWDKTIGGSEPDVISSLQQTNDGGYILGGGSSSNISGEKTETSRGGTDFWLVKLDSSGNIQWDKTIGGGGDETVNSVQQTNDGGYILGGYSNSNISGEKSDTSRGDEDYWIVKLSASGNIEWDKTIGGSREDYLICVRQTADGYIIGGYSYSNISGEKTENTKGYPAYDQDYWIVKVDNLGNVQWDKTIGGSSVDQFSSLEPTTDGGYILGGYSISDISAEKTQRSRGGFDYWVVKLSASGTIQWDKTIGGSEPDYLYSLGPTSDGGYILGGESSSDNSGEKTEDGRGGPDYWVVKLSASGNIQWDKTIGGNASDYLLSVREIEKSHYMLGGSSFSGRSGDKTQWNRGGNYGDNGTADYWLVELIFRKPVSLEVIANNINASENNNTKIFSVYPNPAKDIFYIQTTGKATFTLTDQSGKIILIKAITNQSEINVAHLPAGLYYVKNNEPGVVQKILISR
jgi:hypothetical protein